MDVTEVKAIREKLSARISTLLNEFEATTGTKVTKVNLFKHGRYVLPDGTLHTLPILVEVEIVL